MIIVLKDDNGEIIGTHRFRNNTVLEHKEKMIGSPEYRLELAIKSELKGLIADISFNIKPT